MKIFLERQNRNLFTAYQAHPPLIQEHFGIEQTVLAGGYGYRQILELVQNGADAILEATELAPASAFESRIQVTLRNSCLYVANTGARLTTEGIEALLSSHHSTKRGNQIGRFGLGFKSLLKLNGKIDVFTKSSGDFRFDPVRCRAAIQKQFGIATVPSLRLAWHLENEARASDPVIQSFSWAETIVRAEIASQELLEHLKQEMQAFPAQFLLFFPVATKLVLDDGGETTRDLSVSANGREFQLRDGEDVSRWWVEKIDVKVTDSAAINDATHIHARESVPLAWAYPLERKREEAGRFWAFFPTHTPTYLPGILNAPWKLNSDRNDIIRGEWNAHLMSHAARLICSTLKAFSTPDDPGRPLDAFPRQLERQDEIASPLVEAIWNELKAMPIIPDATGEFRLAQDLWRHPKDDDKLAQQWQSIASSNIRAVFVHPACLTRQRAARLNDFANRIKPSSEYTQTNPCLKKCECVDWFRKVASTQLPQALNVLRLAKLYSNTVDGNEWSVQRSSIPIIPTIDAKLATSHVAVFAPQGVSVPDRAVVSFAISEEPEAKQLLIEVMKVKHLDDSVWESVLENSINFGWRSVFSLADADTSWKAFWRIIRCAPANVRDAFLSKHKHQICVYRGDKTWRKSRFVLLPGELVDADDHSSARRVLVDDATHGGDLASLRLLGVTALPSGVTGPCEYEKLVDAEEGLNEWLKNLRQAYFGVLNVSRKPQWDYIRPLQLALPNSWFLLPKLIGIPNAKVTTTILAQFKGNDLTGKILVGHFTRPEAYPKIEAGHPLGWLLLKYGTIQVGSSVVPLPDFVARRDEPALTKLPGWLDLRGHLQNLHLEAAKLQVTPASTKHFWQAVVDLLCTPEALAANSLQELWTGAAKDGFVPAEVRTDSGLVSLEDVYVTGSPDLARRVRQLGFTVVTLDEVALNLWIEHGAKNLSALTKPVWSAESAPASLLVSVFPELKEVLLNEFADQARCQPVANLGLRVGENTQPVPCLMFENTLLVDTVQLGRLPRSERLRTLLSEVSAAGWLAVDPTAALNRLGNAQLEERRSRVAQGNTLAERLLLAVGSRIEPLRAALGELADKPFILNCTPIQIAELVLAQHGPATLSAVIDTLKEEDLHPPSRWNTSEARAFVASIGFPDEYAASPSTRREAEEYISGPIDLPPLHDFQGEVLDGVRGLVSSSTKRRRCVVSLPTGGGKTRVTVEAAVLLVLKPESDNRSVVWVAQTDELCEQAVQAFRQVWLNLGAKRTDLRIVRLWGSNPNPAIQDLDKPVAVIASIQTLNSRMGSNGLAWLQKPGLVVVDECHHAITPSYTNLLGWLDAEAPRPGAQEKDEPPIVGLSATPFRTDDEESRRLAKRFDNRWFPSNQQQLHTRLRTRGVLAQTVYEPLPSGARLLDDELRRLDAFKDLEGLDFDRLLEEINQRLAGDTKRNERIVERLQNATEESILFFANSVTHAKEIAARLNLVGIAAAAISGETPTVARRYFLDQFQRKKIRVLCNHSVLTTGFDAPKTDMVFISRQVFSPVRYMQMVGRGLRGEKNGGTAMCRIVTVIDNLGRFQDRHPYQFCQDYYSERGLA